MGLSDTVSPAEKSVILRGRVNTTPYALNIWLILLRESRSSSVTSPASPRSEWQELPELTDRTSRTPGKSHPRQGRPLVGTFVNRAIKFRRVRPAVSSAMKQRHCYATTCEFCCFVPVSLWHVFLFWHVFQHFTLPAFLHFYMSKNLKTALPKHFTSGCCLPKRRAFLCISNSVKLWRIYRLFTL